MRVKEFIPGIGQYFLYKRLTNEKDMAFSEKAYQASVGSAYSAGLTLVGMNTNIAAARKAYVATAGSPVIGVAAMLASATAYAPQIASKQYQTAMTGQPTASDSRLVFNVGQGLDYFRF